MLYREAITLLSIIESAALIGVAISIVQVTSHLISICLFFESEVSFLSIYEEQFMRQWFSINTIVGSIFVGIPLGIIGELTLAVPAHLALIELMWVVIIGARIEIGHKPECVIPFYQIYWIECRRRFFISFGIFIGIVFLMVVMKCL